VPTAAKNAYFDTYWQEQDHTRVSQRAHWRAEMLHRLTGNDCGTLLDVGAGQGEVLGYFQRLGWEVTGWDISPEAVARLDQQGFRASVVDIEQDDLRGEYDLVCCSEVLQQVHEPEEVLRKLVSVTARRGCLWITLPNEFHFLRRLGIGKPVESHCSLFSVNRARALVRSGGITTVETLYQPLTPPRWGRVLHWLGVRLAHLWPSLFALSIMMLLRRNDDN
jgi:SAM-dependent methyltransferase